MRNKKLIALLIFVLTAIFYIYTLLPSLAWGDGAILQSEAVVLKRRVIERDFTLGKVRRLG